ncbi:hypothetical protein HPB48_005663 [Haemaphysalis longicornis]|uniref:Serpin domain-containing protein n=1 Tax=Haemaphysalis longicornis TaxID=44386 RepID=A0A9J6GCE5_HAELO|nr:hypothetical protein HPB48_005663 [Haemaphysalis longicornis]
MAMSLSNAVGYLAVDLYDQLRHARTKRHTNVICSPLSMAAALAMTLGGARAKTAEELYAVLRAKEGRTHQFFASFMHKLSSTDRNADISIANRLYCDERLAVQASYMEFLNAHYGSEIIPVDFANKCENVRAEINQWVKTMTDPLMMNVLARDSISPSTSVLLVSAMHFTGIWESPFLASSTSRQDFHLSTKHKVKVDMMYQKQDFAVSHSAVLKARAIELPYHGRRTSMIILLPDEIEGLHHLEHHLSVPALLDLLGGLKDLSDVKLSVPKLVVNQCLSYKSILTTMGITELFSESCDLSGIFNDAKPQISDVVHKSFLRIDEEGTEGASATAAMICGSTGLARGPPVDFVVNHPFMLLVAHNKPDVILFVGSVRKPEKLEDIC